MPARRRALMLCWPLAGVAELVLAHGTMAPASAEEAVGSLAIWGIAGALHARLSPDDWRGSPAWPALIWLAMVGARCGPLDGLVNLALAPITLGVAVVAARVITDLTRPLPAAFVGVVALAAAATGARGLVLFTAPVAQPVQRLAADLSAPFTHLRPPPTPTRSPPIVVITIDTLRADAAPRMQTWQHLSERGATWPNAMSTASWTVPALASLWTGQLPGEHGAGNLPDGGFSPIRADQPTLPERLQTYGYRTAAFVVNPFAAGSLGFSRGFDVWQNADEHVPQPLTWLGAPAGPERHDADRAVAAAVRWLDDAPPTGWMLWVHLFDPHLPYRHLDPSDPASAVGSPHQLRDDPPDAELQAAMRRAYANEVAHADAASMRLIDALDGRGFFTTGTLVFTADHGEEFWEHGGFEHGHSHHGEVTDVPLAIVSPGVAPGERTGQLASLVDIASTIAPIAGLPAGAPPVGVDLRDKPAPGRIVLAAGNLYDAPQRSGRQANARLILTEDPASDAPAAMQLFDLATDPTEQRPRAVDPGARLTDAVLQVRTAASGEAAAVNEEALKALGYMD